MNDDDWNVSFDIYASAHIIEHAMLLPGVGHATLLVLLDDLKGNLKHRVNCKRNRKGNRIRNRGYGLEEMAYFSDLDFKKMFRLSRSAFLKLERVVASEFPGDTARFAEFSSGSAICITTRVAVTLRWLAGGSYIDICFEFGVARGTFYQDGGVLWGTLLAIDRHLMISFPFNDTVQLDKMASGFSNCCGNELHNCVLAVDGWVCKTRKPFVDEVENQVSYRNRHDCFGIVVMAGCDSNCKYHMFSCISAGSTNDIFAWECSAMKENLDNNLLPAKYYFIGDEAFINGPQFLTPWSGHGLDRWSDSFNYHLSAMRQCIERSFALLTQRWGIFWRPLRCAFDKWTLVCTVCAKLHNFCIDNNEGRETDIAPRHPDDYEVNDEYVVRMNENGVNNVNNGDGVERGARPTGDRRRLFTRDLADRGISRPGHARRHSRM